MMKLAVLTILIVIFECGQTADPLPQEEAKANKVEVAIYQLTQSKWDAEVGKKYKTLLIEAANEKCGNNPTSCGLKTHKESFQEGNFEMTDGYPSYKKPYLNISYSLKFPDNPDLIDYPPTKFYLNQKALIESSKQFRQKFIDETGYQVLMMNDEKFYLPPNVNLNIIMCVVAVVIFIACIVLLFVLRFTCSHAHKPEPVEKLKVSVDAENHSATRSSKDNLQNTGV